MIKIVGLGRSSDDLTLGGVNAIKTADKVILKTAK